MNKIVRRSSQSLAKGESTADFLPERVHLGKGMSVTSQRVLGIDPQIHIAWAVEESYWHLGYILMVFHSPTGFSPDEHPDDLSRHGQLIIETRQDGNIEEHPAEGTHFYTFVLRKKVLLGLAELMSVVRFSETIPSAKVAIGRIQDKMQLEELLRRHELDPIEFEAKLNEAKVRLHHSRQRLADLDKPPAKAPSGSRAEALIAEELAGIDAVVLAFNAKRRKVKELKHDPQFLELSDTEQKTILDEIESRLDAAEISARREMRKS